MEDLLEIIEENQVKYAQIKPEDIKTTNELLFKATAEIRGKMHRRNTKKYKTKIQGELPKNMK